MYTTLTFLGKRVIQTNPSKFDEKVILRHIFVQIIFLKQGREIHDFMFLGMEFKRDAQAKDMLVLNKSSLGLGT